MKKLFVFINTLMIAGCSVFGDNGVEDTPYKVVDNDADNQIEVRRYEPMILVSTSMSGSGQNNAFRKLFRYITGENIGANDIAMTAPVFMGDDQANQGVDIPMTAPVFMDEKSTTPTMSFVMPKDFTMKSTPKPTDPNVWVSEINNYSVAAIQFSGFLSDSNIEKHTKILSQWIKDKGYSSTGKVVSAGYNGPFTIPMFRKNEVLMEIQL
jgi:hypothetical protein